MGAINAQDLKSDTVIAKLKGGGVIRCNASVMFNYECYGTGSVINVGHPTKNSRKYIRFGRKPMRGGYSF